MKKTMEILNLVVGFELLIIGIIYLTRLDISTAAGWSIFGCMYIVMDKYTVLENVSKRRNFVDKTKYCAAWLGVLISTAFLLYVLLTP